MKNGYIEKPFGEGKLALKFGVNAHELFCKMHNVEFHEMGEKMAGLTGERDLVFCAAHAAALSAGKDFTITKYQIGDWIEDMPQKDYDEIMDAFMDSKISGMTVKELIDKAEEMVK